MKTCDIKKRKVQDFFVYLIVINLIDWSCFCFIGTVKITIDLAINRVVSFAISRAMSIKKKIAVSFSRLSLQQAMMRF